MQEGDCYDAADQASSLSSGLVMGGCSGYIQSMMKCNTTTCNGVAVAATLIEVGTSLTLSKDSRCVYRVAQETYLTPTNDVQIVVSDA